MYSIYHILHHVYDYSIFFLLTTMICLLLVWYGIWISIYLKVIKEGDFKFYKLCFEGI